MQLNHKAMVEAKEKAHEPYEYIRSELPKLCEGRGVDANKLEAFIVGQLNSSALDLAVSALSAKAEGLFLYAYFLEQHLEGERAAGRSISFDELDALPAGLNDVYAVNFKRAFPDQRAWDEATPLLELIAAAREPVAVTRAAALLGWAPDEQERVLELTALLFPVRDGQFHVFHKTVVDWLTGERGEASRNDLEFRIDRRRGHERFASAFGEWLGARVDDESKPYWLKHGIVHMCLAGLGARALHTYSSDLWLLQSRIDAGLLGVVAKDYLELSRCTDVDLTSATQMHAFVGRHRDVLEREGGSALMQLASQQPDQSVVFGAWRRIERKERCLIWRNKPQTFDPCIATLAHPSEVKAIAVSKRHIVGGAGEAVYVYDAATRELLETFACESEVTSVAIIDSEEGCRWIAAGLENGSIRVWDSGARFWTALFSAPY
ncbi:MAG: hypothetical protein ACO32I_08230 [Candidatus Limnocylindrus sp.]